MTRKVKRPPDGALAARMFTAQAQAEARAGRRLSLEEIGAEVARRTTRGEPAAPSVVRRWLRGFSEPNLVTLHALAAVFGVDPGWLAFGETAPVSAPATTAAAPLAASLTDARARITATKEWLYQTGRMPAGVRVWQPRATPAAGETTQPADERPTDAPAPAPATPAATARGRRRAGGAS